jgi:hypothetical protein
MYDAVPRNRSRARGQRAQGRRARRIALGGVVPERLGQAEVEHLDLPLGGDLDVGGLEVAMDDPLAVRLLQGGGDLRGQLQGLFDRQGSLERRARHVLQHEVGLPAGFLQAIDGGDVGVIELSQHLRLALEARQPLVVLREGGRQKLQSHLPVQACVARAVHLPHAPRPELFHDLVVRQRPADHME